MKCRVCDKPLHLSKEERYDVVKPGGLSLLASKPRYEAFDCLYCGCQNVVRERYECVTINKEEDVDEEK